MYTNGTGNILAPMVQDGVMVATEYYKVVQNIAGN